MKKSIIALSILLTGILTISPVTFAQNKANINYKQINQNVINNQEEVNININNTITKEEAKELLKLKNPNIQYLYQGDENTFTVLKEKGLSGYVFLPDVEGDMGYFVDKTTQNIYYFHPSGYLELIK